MRDKALQNSKSTQFINKYTYCNSIKANYFVNLQNK